MSEENIEETESKGESESEYETATESQEITENSICSGFDSQQQIMQPMNQAKVEPFPIYTQNVEEPVLVQIQGAANVQQQKAANVVYSTEVPRFQTQGNQPVVFYSPTPPVHAPVTSVTSQQTAVPQVPCGRCLTNVRKDKLVLYKPKDISDQIPLFVMLIFCFGTLGLLITIVLVLQNQGETRQHLCTKCHSEKKKEKEKTERTLRNVILVLICVGIGIPVGIGVVIGAIYGIGAIIVSSY